MQILEGAGPFVATLMANQTAVHAIPAAINRLTEALLGTVGAQDIHVRVVNNPMPEVPGELSVKIQETAGEWLSHLARLVTKSMPKVPGELSVKTQEAAHVRSPQQDCFAQAQQPCTYSGPLPPCGMLSQAQCSGQWGCKCAHHRPNMITQHAYTSALMLCCFAPTPELLLVLWPELVLAKCMAALG